jgi:hypothetical protein
LLHEELFGPIVTVFAYPDGRFSDIVETVDKTSRYG